MIPVGHTYRPEGQIDARSVLAATILGVVTAVFAAIVVWAWELSPVPTLVILTPFLQGLLIGIVLTLLIGRLKLRHPKLMASVGFACGLASVGLIHYAHYLHFLDEVGAEYKASVEADADLTPAKKQELLAKIDQGSNAMANGFLFLKTGHRGFVGSMLLRNQVGVTLKSASLTGWGLWILWGFEAAMVAAVAATMAHARASEPFCEDCGRWCAKTRAPIELGGESAGALGDAVRASDHGQAAQLLDQPVDAEAIKQHGTRAALHSCGECDQTFADVESYRITMKKGKTETATTSVAKQVRIAPELVALLRRHPAVIEPAEQHLIDDPTALEARDL